MTEAPSAPNLNGLADLSNRDGVDIRPTLLRVMTDLYVQKQVHTEQEEKHFTVLALRLIELVDADTRALIANKIAGYPNAPAAVRHRLLKELITLQPAEQADPEINPLAERGPAPAEELSELFFASSAEERRLILLNLPYALLAPAAPVASDTAIESIHRLEAAAMGHNGEVFARELARILGVSRDHGRRLIEDPTGEPIVVAAVALGMPAAVLQRILLCLDPAISQSVQCVYDLAQLHEELEPNAARRLIAIWQMSHPAEKRSSGSRTAAAHQPQYWQDESERSAPAAPVTRPKVAWDELMQKRHADGA